MKDDLKVCDIVQFHPDHPYGGQLVVVEELKPFGGQGIIFTDHEIEGLFRWEVRAYIRFKFDDVVKVGRMEWVVKNANNSD